MPEQFAYCIRCGRSASQWPDAILSILIKTEADRPGYGVAPAESSGIGVADADVDPSSLESSADEVVAGDAGGDVGLGEGGGGGVGGAPEIFWGSSSGKRFFLGELVRVFRT